MMKSTHAIWSCDDNRQEDYRVLLHSIESGDLVFCIFWRDVHGMPSLTMALGMSKEVEPLSSIVSDYNLFIMY